ncbi:unnamed protein product [Sphenostylis stenocarpa]|uniref:Uncharacterized protein n=1 Tax=Sphenostylis stenocarpa TaxID=92480 RepID=A0AA86S1N7_9FABA|nr:unnamed protein product [Sphenostylis stenocarpa]
MANSLAVRKAWEKPVFMGDRELGKARVAVSSGYESARLEAESAKQAQTIKDLLQDLTRTRSEIRQEREANRRLNKSLAELRCKERDGLAQYDQVLQEKDQALAKLDELQALVIHQEARIKEAQKYSEDMSQAVQKQSEALARHVREAKRELCRDQDLPVGFFRLFRFCQKLLRSME